MANIGQGTFKEIAKNPLVYALTILGFLVGVFANNWSNSKNEALVICEHEKAEKDKVIQDKDARLIDLYNKLLIKNKIIEHTDSIARNTIKKEADEVLRGK